MAFNKDLGTSSSELTLGTHIQVPGAILMPASSQEDNINDILAKLQFKNGRVAIPTSTNPQEEVEPPSDGVTHVYAKQHDIKGLMSRYKGPFRVITRPTRTTLQVKVGLTPSGEVRSELRNWADVKPAKLRDGVADAERPKRGRPPKAVTNPPADTPGTEENSNDGGNSSPSRPVRATRNPAPNYVETIDFSKPPPGFLAGNLNSSTTRAEPRTTTGPPPFRGFLQGGSWSASSKELEEINRSISRTSGR